MNVSPGISTTIVVKYNDYNRKLVIDPKSFVAAGVNTTTNTITISNHGYVTGDKVIHTSSIPCGGLVDNETYYIVVFDNNTFKLANTYYDANEAKAPIVGITSTSIGTINPVNPNKII